MRGSPGLRHFEKAAKKDSQYIFEAAHFKKGIWTYVGRTQYATGRYAQARQSLGLALSTHEEDRLARLYLGLVLLRGGFELQGLPNWWRAPSGSASRWNKRSIECAARRVAIVDDVTLDRAQPLSQKRVHTSACGTAW